MNLKSQPKKIIFFGFSVTEQGGGYAMLIKKYAADNWPGSEIVVRGVGGVFPDAAAYDFERMIPGGHYDLAVLEISTTVYGQSPRWTEEGCLLTLSTLIAKASRVADSVAMIHLYRSDMDLISSDFLKCCDQVNGRLGIPSINIGRMVSEMPLLTREKFLRDEVHTTEFGSEQYCGMVVQFLEELDSQKICLPPVIMELADELQAVGFADMEPHGDIELFSRSGNTVRILRITEGESVKIRLNAEFVISGLAYLKGPETGRLRMAVGSGFDTTIEAYDEYCYYERYHTYLGDDAVSDYIEISQLIGRPAIKLRKGEVDEGPRVGKVAYLLCSKTGRKFLHGRLVDFFHNIDQ